MRVLVLSCNTGQGHNSAANAVKKTMEDNGVYCEVKDALGFISKASSAIISKGHVFIYRHAPLLFKVGYRSSEKHRGIFKEKSLMHRFFALGAKKMYKYCVDGGFDVIIVSHAFAALMLSVVKKRYPLSARTYFFATDYTCSPSAEQSDLDTYFIPDALLTEEFSGFGIPRNRIVAGGIPVRKEFFNFTDKSAAKQQLDVDEDRVHLLLMCGSMGCGPMKKLAKRLSKQLTHKQCLTIICGTNKRLRKRLTKRFKSNENVRVLGFVDDISLYMDSADLYITKPGGISVSEAAVKGLPMVFINAVAGCEVYNMHYYIQRGCAVTAEGTAALADLCINLASDPSSIEQMSASVKALNPINASEFIYDYIIGDNK